MKKSILIFVVLLSILHWNRGIAADNETIWNEASEYYDEGNYSSAIANYHNLIDRGYTNSDLYYNLGNCYYKSSQIGMAIWAYRRALSINPGMEQARTNIEFARKMNLDKIETAEGGFITDIWRFLIGMFDYNEFLIIFTVTWWILAALAALLIFRGNFASWPYYLLIAAVILAIFSATAAAGRIKIDRFTTWGVLVDNAADIREGPGKEYERIEIGHEGLEFKIIGEREESYLVELENGLKGWIYKKAVMVI